MLCAKDLHDGELDEHGQPRHATGILMARAWKIQGKPILRDVISQLPYEATPSAYLLDPDEANKILDLAFEEVQLPNIKAINEQRDLIDALAPRGPTRGPKPTNWSKTVTHSSQEESSVYILRFGSTNVWKVGHAKDVVARLIEVNKHVPSELLGQEWKIVHRLRFPTQEQAWAIEQKTLQTLSAFRTIGERVRCDEKTLNNAWAGSVAG
ncbi:MAG: hypothetical protein HC869_23755 [Rhodospirillales bacterium]|nr:hypothetical protein [Rhodospirillales bacterium]